MCALDYLLISSRFLLNCLNILLHNAAHLTILCTVDFLDRWRKQSSLVSMKRDKFYISSNVEMNLCANFYSICLVAISSKPQIIC